MDRLDNTDNSRLQRAMLLCLLFYFFWMSLFAPQPAVQSSGELQSEQSDLTTLDQTKDSSLGKVIQKNLNTDTSTENTDQTTKNKIKKHSRKVENKTESFSIISDTAAISSIILNEYTKNPEVQSWWWALFSEDDWEPYSGGEELLEIGSDVSMIAATFDQERNLYPAYITKEGENILIKQNMGLVVVEKIISRSENPFTYKVEINVKNNSSQNSGDLFVAHLDIMKEDNSRFQKELRPQLYVDDSLEIFIDLDDIRDEKQKLDKNVSWFGLGTQFFLIASEIEEKEQILSSSVEHIILNNTEYYGSFVKLKGIPAGTNATFHMDLFMGPKQMEVLRNISDDWTYAVDYGIFGFFSRVLLFMLKLFYMAVQNWGVAILFLTLTIKLIFFPLTQKAFVSARKMQLLQPQLNEIREKYKDNQQVQAQKTMALFQKHGTSPVSGCLPTLIQLPVWLALYNVMLYSVELYDSSFLYIQDLTSTDPYGILPVLYTVMMFFQMRLMPTSSDPSNEMQQQMQQMMKIMPLMFGIFMFTFPSGLVLYFSFNIMFTGLQQYFIRTKFSKITLEEATV